LLRGELDREIGRQGASKGRSGLAVVVFRGDGLPLAPPAGIRSVMGGLLCADEHVPLEQEEQIFDAQGASARSLAASHKGTCYSSLFGGHLSAFSCFV